jgi:hypothetical protein
MLSVDQAYSVCQVKVYGKGLVFAKYNLSGMKKKGRHSVEFVALFFLLSSICRYLTDIFLYSLEKAGFGLHLSSFL